MSAQNNNEWKEILAVGVSIALVILAMGGCMHLSQYHEKPAQEETK